MGDAVTQIAKERQLSCTTKTAMQKQNLTQILWHCASCIIKWTMQDCIMS